jgi:hypothetical protein
MLCDPEAYPLKDLFGPIANSDRRHDQVCDGACYLCLHRYANRSYHGLLDWRLGLAFLRSLLEPTFRCGLDGRFADAPEVSDWPALARGYAEQMAQRFGGRSGGETTTIGALPAFRFDRAHEDWAVVVHPLWNKDGPTEGLLADAVAAFGGRNLQPVDTFDLARRPVRVRERLLASWLGG